MLKVSTEFRKGILFVRLKGRIDNESYLEGIDSLINSIGIRFIVFNINDLNDVSIESVKNIINYNQKILDEKKLLLICDERSVRNCLFKNIIPNIKREIDAFSLV